MYADAVLHCGYTRQGASEKSSQSTTTEAAVNRRKPVDTIVESKFKKR